MLNKIDSILISTEQLLNLAVGTSRLTVGRIHHLLLGFLISVCMQLYRSCTVVLYAAVPILYCCTVCSCTNPVLLYCMQLYRSCTVVLYAAVPILYCCTVCSCTDPVLLYCMQLYRSCTVVLYAAVPILYCCTVCSCTDPVLLSSHDSQSPPTWPPTNHVWPPTKLIQVHSLTYNILSI